MADVRERHRRNQAAVDGYVESIPVTLRRPARVTGDVAAYFGG